MLLNWIKSLLPKKQSIPSLLQSQPLNTIEYILNDPLTPNLSEHVSVPTDTSLPHFAVVGWNGQAISDVQKQAAQVYVCMYITNQMLRKYSTNQPFTNWAAVDTLVANPRAGWNFNAYYDRTSLQFFFQKNPITNAMVFTCMSPNIVAHEHGHAFLDSLRPDLWNTQALEIFAFHESFADIVSMLNTFMSDTIINHVLQETDNDLRKSNIVSRIAEEMGNAIFNSGVRTVQVDALRNAVNDLRYINPEVLPTDTHDGSLCQEPHNFSRLFTGAWYDCLTAIYEHEKASFSTTPVLALKSARDSMASITFNAVPLAAATPRFYSSFGKAMLLTAGKYMPLLREVFVKRGIIDIPLMAMSSQKVMDISQCDEKRAFIADQHIVLRIGEQKTIMLLGGDGDGGGKLRATNLPFRLMQAHIEVPNEKQVVLDANHRIVEEVACDEDRVIHCAHAAVNYLHQKCQIGDHQFDTKKTFSLVDGKLVRNRTCI